MYRVIAYFFMANFFKFLSFCIIVVTMMVISGCEKEEKNKNSNADSGAAYYKRFDSRDTNENNFNANIYEKEVN